MAKLRPRTKHRASRLRQTSPGSRTRLSSDGIHFQVNRPSGMLCAYTASAPALFRQARRNAEPLSADSVGSHMRRIRGDSQPAPRRRPRPRFRGRSHAADWRALTELGIDHRKCHTVSQEHHHWAIQPTAQDRLAPWAASAMVTEDDPQSQYFNWKAFRILGNYRGLVVSVKLHRLPEPTANDFPAAVKVFDGQIAKLESAP